METKTLAEAEVTMRAMHEGPQTPKQLLFSFFYSAVVDEEEEENYMMLWKSISV